MIRWEENTDLPRVDLGSLEAVTSIKDVGGYQIVIISPAMKPGPGLTSMSFFLRNFKRFIETLAAR